MVTVMLSPAFHHAIHVRDGSDGDDGREVEVVGGILATDAVGQCMAVVWHVVHHIEVAHFVFTGGPGW